MNTENKKGIRWLLFRLFGPKEVQNLVMYIDELTEETSDFVMYASGEFHFQVRTLDGMQTLTFETHQERQTFQHGMELAFQLTGHGDVYSTSDDPDFDTLSTHSVKKGIKH